jgi:phospholipid/cholesterol/gamma-HCH transport system permease protein
MRIDPVAYLISPRIVAALLSFPLLTALFDLIGIAGGYLTGVVLAGANAGSYYANVQSSITLADINGGFIKSVIFAAIVATVCCFHGYYTHMQSGPKGAKGVSLSTTSAVVQSCVFILIADYLTTSFLL